MKRRKLGRVGPEVSALGLGRMSLSGSYGRARTAESLDAVAAAREAGIAFFDPAEAYGDGPTEELAARALGPERETGTRATTVGLRLEGGRLEADGRPVNVRRAAEGSLRRLGVECIDLYYLHRRDPKVPIEETVGALAELVDAGLVRWLGLSEVSATTLRRAHTIHPITAVQSEYSLWTRAPADGVLAACRELGVGFVPYCPLGRGFLTGRFPGRSALAEHDIRLSTPYFEEAHVDHNQRLARQWVALAKELGATGAQLALAWLLHQGPEIVPIFGTRRRSNLTENAAAARLVLDEQTLSRIAELVPRGAASGDSAPAVTAHLADR